LPATIGIRLEDKSKWERRVPLTPADAAGVQACFGHRLIVQPSPIRVFADREYREAGIEVSDAALEADVLIAVKEIPPALYRPGKVYVNFAHVIKGQARNMPLLREYLRHGCTLVDYECIADEHNRRLIFFSVHAGYAGTIEALRALGLRLQGRGVATPLAEIQPPHAYADLTAAEAHLRGIGERLRADARAGAAPLVIGVAGYGNVARGVQTVLSWLPTARVAPSDLPAAASAPAAAPLLVCVFKEQDMVRPRDGREFALQDYYDHPEAYAGRFAEHLPHLDLLVNTIFWTERYPRLLTADWAAAQFRDGREPRLQVVGDISIDIEGSIQISVKATQPDAPCYVVDPVAGEVRDGVDGRGIVVMAVDNLPCELPREASEHFSTVLKDMVGDLGNCDWTAEFLDLDLPPHLKRAVIVHRGELAPRYAYLAEFLERGSRA